MLEVDASGRRELKTDRIQGDYVVVGGGLAGTCAAITAARAGLQTVLVHDRPVLGGNASSEVRLWALGATSHMGNNNRWAREGGVINELLLENTHRNPEGNPVIFDTVLLEAAHAEPNLRLLLNTAAHDIGTTTPGRIDSVTAFCSQNSTRYEISAPLFCDASGDGVLGFLSGAAFRIGAESCGELGELWAPDAANQQLLGHSLYFYTRDTGKPVRFVAPGFALKDITQIPRYRQFNTQDQGCQLWWIEYGGSRDTVHDTEEIKWELWKIVYGVWDYIKNSGEFPDAENLTLEWVGNLPGKRESRRFEGDYMLTQQDVVEQRSHEDAVSFGGWAIDLHPVDAIYSAESPCTQWHSKGVYQIPYRCLYSRNVANLFLAGRIISASHIAFGSTRVMMTCAHNAQAVGQAASLCREQNLLPADLVHHDRIRELQRRLLRTGQHIPGVVVRDPADLAQSATIEASSELELKRLEPASHSAPLDDPRAVLLPMAPGRAPELTVYVEAERQTELVAELRTCSRKGSFTLDVTQERLVVPIKATSDIARRRETVLAGAVGDQANLDVRSEAIVEAVSPGEASFRWTPVRLRFSTILDRPTYAAVCLMSCPGVRVATSDQLITGVTSLVHREEMRVAKGSVQKPPPEIGVDEFEFWTPQRRPSGKNLAFEASPPVRGFSTDNATNGVGRPTTGANAWVAALDDPQPSLTLRWPTPQQVGRIELSFDPDYDHPLEQVLMHHPETVMPYCVRSFRIFDDAQQLLFSKTDNHQARCVLRLTQQSMTRELRIEFDAPGPNVPASLFEVRCYPD